MLKSLLYWLVRVLYGFRSYNLAALKTPGPVLLLPNHVSWLDWIFIGVCLDEDWRFVTSSTTAQLSWLHKFIMVNRRTFPVEMTSPYAVKRMAEYLQGGGRLVLFPEGRISTTGSLMKLFDGTGFLIFKTRAKVITAYIRGAARLPLSRNPDPKQWFPRVSSHFSDLLTPPPMENMSVTAARMRLTHWLRDQMVKQRFGTEMEFGAPSVPQAIAETARRLPRKVAVQDVTTQEVSYRRLLVGAQALEGQWRRRLSAPAERVGVLLPNVNAFPVVLLSLWMAGKVPAILNYTHGSAILLACARLAGLKQIITSQNFAARARLDLKPLQDEGIEFIFLEDVRPSISKVQKLAASLRHRFNPRLSGLNLRRDSSAVILFTSGSEGDPKGVELTHGNLLANIRQMGSVIDLMDQDRFFNALPLFHSFGLTVGLLLPLVRGAFVALYVSPLHYRVVPSAFNNLNCTVFFGTNTFLAGYARKAHPSDFSTLRYLFAGAEKIQETTTTTWMQRFGVRVLEGYGATECSPCLSANLPMRPRQGSAGQFLPGIEYRLEHVEGVGEAPTEEGRLQNEEGQGSSDKPPITGHESPMTESQSPIAERQAPLASHSPLPTLRSALEVGRLFVRGPNVMRGYLNREANEKFHALDGWYDTGDIVKVDADGFVFILGRLKRFAKVSGEMVSLTALEDALAGAFPQYGLHFAVAVLARPDEAKGEKLVVATNEPRLTLEAVREAVRARGLGNLAVPREIKVVRELPKLGTGKVNHRELERMV
ncbi:MAG TPA: AMP-binding protein [Candidatus Acidoferrum sp.]|jgi:acyl-[acyl-carrier-protein]-phospholipid O-acyltransferase/long-chain-fatty-acid--[acyl-carrier-protein] ligase|nr:AMP-binding protein [Candidatus Acidoferrum sp.]